MTKRGGHGWDQVGRREGRDSSKFLDVGDGETKRVRPLDDKPYTFFTHRINYAGPGVDEPIFEVIPATEDPDDDYIDKHTNRYPAQPRHAMRVLTYDDEGEPGEIKVLEGGVQLFRDLKKIHEKVGDITTVDVEISREGEGLKTKWDASVPLDQYEVDIEPWLEAISEDDEWDFGNLYPPATPDEQKRMLERANIDITWDPVEELAEEMSVEEALKLRMPFGKYGPDYFPRGKTIRDIATIDPDYLSYMADNITSNDEVAAAMRVVLDNMESLGGMPEPDKLPGDTQDSPFPETPEDPPEHPVEKQKKGTARENENHKIDEETGLPEWPLKQDIETYLRNQYHRDGKRVPLALAHLEAQGKKWDPDQKKAVPATETQESGANGKSKDDMKQEIIQVFQDDDRFEDAMDVLNVIKKHGDGKARINDLDEKQMASLHQEVVG